MTRIRIEDLPVQEEIQKEQARDTLGGFTASASRYGSLGNYVLGFGNTIGGSLNTVGGSLGGISADTFTGSQGGRIY